MKGEGLWADLLKQRFANAVRRLGLNARNHGILDMSHFKRVELPKPLKPATPYTPQLSLF
jgi:hypothetical protein